MSATNTRYAAFTPVARVQIGAQQVRVSRDHLRIKGVELDIANLQRTHANETLDFLVNQFTNAELYDWMSRVLEEVYASFLQQATAMAQVALTQLAFERQEPVPQFIQADYWEPASGLPTGAGDGQSPDRRGLTGSVRLLQDLVQLDQFAFATQQRKQTLTKTFSLARMAPAEFQQFRQTGVLRFATREEAFDRDFPGHYLRLIRRVQVSVIALVPPTEGIKATLSTSGISGVTTRNGTFSKAVIRRLPESVSFSSPLSSRGGLEIALAQETELLRPFEGSGVDIDWTFELPQAGNQFDFSTIADVLLTVEYTSLFSDEYRKDVVGRLGRDFAADRGFSFRHELVDQWFDLNNPELSATPLTVRFEVRRADFLPISMSCESGTSPSPSSVWMAPRSRSTSTGFRLRPRVSPRQ